MFVLKFPVANAAATELPELDLRPDGAAMPRPGHSTSRRLLLVEDHPDTSRVLERLLRGIGYEVTTADGVNSAIAAFEKAPLPFDIVVSDIGLPDGSGLDLARQLRLRSPGIPAVALSGFGMQEDRIRSTEAGFSAHLTKPIDLLVLQSTIERVMA